MIVHSYSVTLDGSTSSINKRQKSTKGLKAVKDPKLQGQPVLCIRTFLSKLGIKVDWDKLPGAFMISIYVAHFR